MNKGFIVKIIFTDSEYGKSNIIDRFVFTKYEDAEDRLNKLVEKIKEDHYKIVHNSTILEVEIC